MTQVELARRLGKDQSYVSLIERCQRRVDVVEFLAISSALHLDPVGLLAEIVSEVAA